MYSQWVEQEQGSSYSVAEREHEGSSERERERLLHVKSMM